MKKWFLPVLALSLALTPVLAANTGRREKAPNVTLEVYQRSFAIGTKVQLEASLYNLKQVQLAVYPVSLETLAPNAKAVEDEDVKVKGSLPYRLKQLDLSRTAPVATWTAALKTFYADSWSDLTVKVPKGLAPGVYVASIKGGGVEKRTWFAVSTRALLLKRTPTEILAWAVNSVTGQPISGLPIAVYDEQGKRAVKATTGDGLVKLPAPPLRASAWVVTQAGDPAFALASSPSVLDPYIAYLYTDRPIYRPGHLVRFRGTLRARDGAAYKVPVGLEKVKTEIKTRGGMTVYEQELPLNAWGTFSGEFQLAPEPPLGSYEIVTTVGKGDDETRFYQSFEVQAYRKPEFTVSVNIPKSHYVGGDEVIPITFGAKYFFGSPVSGGKLSYTISFSRQGGGIPKHVLQAAGRGVEQAGLIEAELKGTARLGSDGTYRLNLTTLRLPADRTMHVSAEVSETAMRPQSGSASCLLTGAKFRLSLDLDKYTYKVGEKARLFVTTRDHDDQPVSTAVKLSFIENLVDREGRPYQERTKLVLETDSKGQADTVLDLKRLGDHQVEGWAQDADGNAVYAQTSLTVVKKIEQRWPSLELSADKDAYGPGETAVLEGRTDQIGTWLLVTVEGEKLFSSRVVRVQANKFSLQVPLTAEMEPNVEVRAAFIRHGELTSANTDLRLPPEERRLKVIVTPSQERYQPAETASYTLTTRDNHGRSVPAEVGLGVVDASVYEIRSDSTADPFDFFWGDRETRVETDFSLANLYPGGAYQRWSEAAMAPPSPAEAKANGGGGGRDGEAPRVRKFFTDTAYWGPSVVTDANGTAEVKLTVPDNLTTWRATARGMTRETQVGVERKDVVVTLPLLVRFSLPRFYVQGDEATAAATVHNYTGTKRTVKVTLAAEGVNLLEPAEKTITLDNDGIQRLTWKVKVTGKDQARFLVSADGGPGGKDATETTLPVRPDGLAQLIAASGMTADKDAAKLTLPTGAIPGSGLVEVSLAPSLAGPIFETLEYLTNYPYGCAEQTMSSFLPDVVVANTLQKLGAQRPRPKMLDRYANFGLQKLIRYQHNDGGWHWWEFDDSDPYISAYVCYGLRLALDAGYVAARGPLVRGVSYLRTALAEESFRDARAYLLWSMANVNLWSNAEEVKTAVTAAQELFGQRTKLTLFNRASLALALNTLASARGVDPAVAPVLKQNALTLAGELEAAAKPLGTACFWGADGTYRYSWLDNNVEVTAQVLQALLALKPDSARVQPAIRWLMSQRQGKQWTSTKDSAAAVLVLTRYLERAQELQPDFKARVYSGDKLIKEVAFTAAGVFADPVKVAIPATDLQTGDNAIRVEKTGAGNLYWNARLMYLTRSEDVVPSEGPIRMLRTYRVPAEDPTTAGEQRPGNVIHVEVTLLGKENLRYVLLQEPIPAGCEILDSGEDRLPEIGCDRREVWDNRLVMYFDYLPRGEKTFTYALRAEAPGQYRILPTQAELMYFPEVRGNDKPVRLKIGEAVEE